METTFLIIMMIVYTICIVHIGIKIGEFVHQDDFEDGFNEALRQINQMNNNNDKENNEE